jgi:OOP family OmpA-OmpF porin
MGCGPAFAQQWYFGIGAGRGSLSGADYLETTSTFPSGPGGVLTTSSFDPLQYNGHDTALTARYGWRFHPNMALELGYYDFGKYPFTLDTVIPTDPASTVRIQGSTRVRSVGLSLVGIVPLDRFDLYGRIGYARTQVESSGDAAITSVRRNLREKEAFGAVGARWNATPSVGLFAEYQKHDKVDLDGYFAGVDFRF